MLSKLDQTQQEQKFEKTSADPKKENAVLSKKLIEDEHHPKQNKSAKQRKKKDKEEDKGGSTRFSASDKENLEGKPGFNKQSVSVTENENSKWPQSPQEVLYAYHVTTMEAQKTISTQKKLRATKPNDEHYDHQLVKEAAPKGVWLTLTPADPDWRKMTTLGLPISSPYPRGLPSGTRCSRVILPISELGLDKCALFAVSSDGGVGSPTREEGNAQIHLVAVHPDSDALAWCLENLQPLDKKSNPYFAESEDGKWFCNKFTGIPQLGKIVTTNLFYVGDLSLEDRKSVV